MLSYCCGTKEFASGPLLVNLRCIALQVHLSLFIALQLKKHFFLVSCLPPTLDSILFHGLCLSPVVDETHPLQPQGRADQEGIDEKRTELCKEVKGKRTEEWETFCRWSTRKRKNVFPCIDYPKPFTVKTELPREMISSRQEALRGMKEIRF